MGRYDLRLTEAEFWDLTLKELNALIARVNKKEDWLNYRAGMICSVIANAWSTKGAKTRTPEDFFPTETISKAQTPEQILSNITMLNAAFGGEVRLED